MEGLQKWVRSVSNNDTKPGSPNFPRISYILRSEGGFALPFVVDSPSRQLVSLCAVCFVAGIVVSSRVRGWASGLLKRFKGDQ